MKKIMSLILAVTVLLSFCIVPVFAAAGTATVTAALDGETPQAGEKFFVAVTVNDISTGVFRNGGIEWFWPADVASLAKTNGTAITGTNINQAITAVPDPYDGDEGTGTFSKKAGLLDGEGHAYADIYINDESETDASGIDATEQVIYKIAFVLNEGQSYDDFYFTIDAAKFFFADDVSSIANGSLTVKGIKPVAPAVSYTDSMGIVWNAVSDNLVTVDGVTGLTNALNGGDTNWAEVDATTINAEAEAGTKYVHATTIAGGNTADTMRTFFPIEGGKNYLVTHTLYNNTGAATTSHNNAGMSAIIATGDPVYGTFSGLTMYSHVDYTDGGFNSWSNESAPTIVGTKVNRTDRAAEAGYNKIEVLVKAPAEATNIMISYCAWGSVDLYYGDWAIYEVEADELPVDMVINYTYNGEIIATETKTGAIGNTVDVVANTAIAGTDGTTYMVAADETLTFVAGGSTEEVEVAKVETVTINYMLGEEVVGTKTVEGVDGSTVAYDAFTGYNTTAIYEAAAGELTVDADALTVAVDVTVLYEGLVAANKQVDAAEFALPEVITDKGTVAFDVVAINPGDAGVLIGNGENFVNGTHFGAAVAQMNIGPEVIKLRNGANNEETAVSTHGNTYHVVFTIDNTAGTYDAVVTDATGAVVAEKTGLAVRTTAETLDTISVLDNGAAGGTIVVQNLVVETTPDPTEPSDEPTVPSEEPTVPSEEPTVPSEEPTVPSEEPTVPSEEPTVPSEEPTVPSEEPTVPSEEPTVPSEEPTVPSEEPTVPSEEPTVPSEEPTVPSEEPTVPSEEPTVPSEEPTVPSEEPTVPSEEPTVPSEEPTVPSEEPTVPSEEPTVPSEPEDEELPFEAVDVTVTTSALGVTITGKFVDVDTTYDKVVVVISYLKDGKAYSVQAVEVPVENGEVEIPASNVTLTEGELTVAGISVLAGVNALEAITTGNLGTPVGVWKN